MPSMPAIPKITKADLKPKKHHGFSAVLFVMGTLFPPLAVATRFGIGVDFWLNLVLTLCGYIPGHVHNFYIQNIRNNKNHRRTPKWVQRYGLVDTSEIKRKEKKSQWAGRYNERLPRSTLEAQPYEEGQEAGSSVDISSDGHDSRQRGAGGELWRPEDEQFYGQNGDASSTRGTSSGRWHYPANFDDAISEPVRKKRKTGKKDKKDRWARTEDAYSITTADQGSTKRKKSKKKKSTTDDPDTYSRQSGSTTEFPEDAEGGLYGDRQGGEDSTPQRHTDVDDIFSHEL